MKARDAVGKKITSVTQHRFWDVNQRRMVTCIEGIVLEDGTALVPIVTELNNGYAVDLQVYKPRRSEES